MNSEIRSLPILCCVLLGLPLAAQAQEGDQASLYELGKDVARLEQEVKELKTVLSQLLELDKQRVALLSQIVSGAGVSPGVTTTLSTPSTKPEAKEQDGSITGKVKLPEGARVAYVYVDNVPGRMVRGRSLEIAQENKQFTPRWAVVQRGTTVRFPNKDSIYHNVFSRSPEAKFDLGTYRRGDDAKEHTFVQAGIVDVYCNMHSEMSSEILVVPNHLFTKVGNDGRFTLSDVPAGKRKVVVWSPGYMPAERWVTVEANAAADVSLAPGEARTKNHLNKSGQPYGSYK